MRIMSFDEPINGATLYIGRDPSGPPAGWRRAKYFPRLADAVRYAFAEIPERSRADSYIEMNDGTRYDWPRIAVLRRDERAAAE